MRTISRTTQFKRDYKREKKGQHRKDLDQALTTVITKLANDVRLDLKYQDHELYGKLNDCRECHIKPDLLLIYRKPDDEKLDLVRLGSHSELSL